MARQALYALGLITLQAIFKCFTLRVALIRVFIENIRIETICANLFITFLAFLDVWAFQFASINLEYLFI
jgi:hypothetical protein